MKTHSPTAIKAAYGAVLRKHRLAAGLSQMKLADKAGMHFTYVGDAERGQRNIALVNIVRLARALNVPLDGFFRDVENQLSRRESQKK